MRIPRLFIVAIISMCLCAGNLAFAIPQDKPADKPVNTEKKTNKTKKAKKPAREEPKPGKGIK